MDADEDTTALIARLLAEDAAYEGLGSDTSDSDYDE